jgi:hypothetical protein
MPRQVTEEVYHPFDLTITSAGNGDINVWEWHDRWILIAPLPGVH